MNKKLLFCILVFLILVSICCRRETVVEEREKIPDVEVNPSPNSPVAYSVVEPIIRTGCLGSSCHSSPNPKKDTALDNESSLRKFFLRSLGMIVVGDMPPDGSLREKLTPEEVHLLVRWYKGSIATQQQEQQEQE